MLCNPHEFGTLGDEIRDTTFDGTAQGRIEISDPCTVEVPGGTNINQLMGIPIIWEYSVIITLKQGEVR